MKEKKNVKKDVQQVDEMPSKGKIIAAWVMLIVLLGCTGGLIYLKNFSQPVVEEETEETNKVSPVITAALTDIVDKFNAGTIVSGYREEGLNLTASLKDMTITVAYTSADVSGSVDYVYNVAGNLSVTVFNTDEEIKDKIFKAVIIACRDRLNKTEDVLADIDNFINNGTELYGLKKETINDNITYYVDIRYPASAPEVDNQTSGTETSLDQDTNSDVEDNQSE